MFFVPFLKSAPPILFALSKLARKLRKQTQREVKELEKEVKCPWCGEQVVPMVNLWRNEYGDVRERKCPKCSNILAAYFEQEGEFLKTMRTF